MTHFLPGRGLPQASPESPRLDPSISPPLPSAAFAAGTVVESRLLSPVWTLCSRNLRRRPGPGARPAGAPLGVASPRGVAPPMKPPRPSPPPQLPLPSAPRGPYGPRRSTGCTASSPSVEEADGKREHVNEAETACRTHGHAEGHLTWEPCTRGGGGGGRTPEGRSPGRDPGATVSGWRHGAPRGPAPGITRASREKKAKQCD